MTTGEDMTTGENKSIWFDAERLEKIEKITALYEVQTGLRVSRSAIVSRAIDELFLSLCLQKKSIVSDDEKPADIAA